MLHVINYCNCGVHLRRQWSHLSNVDMARDGSTRCFEAAMPRDATWCRVPHIICSPFAGALRACWRRVIRPTSLEKLSEPEMHCLWSLCEVVKGRDGPCMAMCFCPSHTFHLSALVAPSLSSHTLSAWGCTCARCCNWGLDMPCAFRLDFLHDVSWIQVDPSWCAGGFMISAMWCLCVSICPRLCSWLGFGGTEPISGHKV